MLGVAAASGRDGVASGRGVEADGAPVGGAPRIAVVPVVTASEPGSGAARMGRPHDLSRRAGMLTGSPSANSLPVR